MAAGGTTLLDQSVLNLAVPTLRQSLDAGSTDVQWIVAGYSLPFGLMLVPGGILGDARGHNGLFLVSARVIVLATLDFGTSVLGVPSGSATAPPGSPGPGNCSIGWRCRYRRRSAARRSCPAAGDSAPRSAAPWRSPPDLVVCGEPVSALDVSVQAKVLDLPAELQADTGVAYLFISHDLAVVRRIAHQVALMGAGRIVETGTADDLFTRPRHSHIREPLAAIPGDRYPRTATEPLETKEHA